MPVHLLFNNRGDTQTQPQEVVLTSTNTAEHRVSQSSPPSSLPSMEIGDDKEPES